MKTRFMVTVRGKRKEWGFIFDGNLEHLQDWRDDGLEVHEIVNQIPEWAALAGLTRIWIFAQDLWKAIKKLAFMQ